MKKTLLQIVQSTLGAMDSDLVDTIGETVESEQIAVLAEEVYYELATYASIPQFERLAQLVGKSTRDQATVMELPENCTDIKDIRYQHTDANGKTCMVSIHYVTPEVFLNTQLALKVGDDNVDVNLMEDGIKIPYLTDRGPTCWTSFDEQELVFDAVDRAVQGDETLHNDASLVLAYIVPKFKMEDTYTPEIPPKMFSQYMNQIKEYSFNEQKQIAEPIRTRNAERQHHRNRHFTGIYDGSDKGRGNENQGFGRPSVGRGYSSRRGSSGLPIIR